MKKLCLFSSLLLCILAITLIFTSCFNNITQSSTQSRKDPELIISEGLEYELNEDGQSYSIIGLGSWQGENLVIPSEYNGLPVTAIADYAFTDYYYLLPILSTEEMLSRKHTVMIESVVIPDSVTTIGAMAFFNCIYLESVILSNSLTNIGGGAFAGCISLKDVVIPDSLEYIGEATFAVCKSLKRINIPAKVRSIEFQAFLGCISLEKIDVDKNNPNFTSIDNNLYSKDGKELIQYALGQNELSFEIPNSVENIAPGAFSFSRQLTHITIPESMTIIGEDAFRSCYGLVEVNIPNSIKVIEERAFANCFSLTSITIPESVVSVSDNAFDESYSLVELCNKSAINLKMDCHIITDEHDSNIVYVGDYIFYDDGEEIYLVKYIGNETELVLPEYKNGAEYGIYKYAFYDDAIDFWGRPIFFQIMSDENNGITSITIPEYVISIGEYAFFGCSLINEMYIHKGVIQIGEYAFGGCDNLTVYCASASRLDTWNKAWNYNIYQDRDGKHWMISTVWNYDIK